jgi:hypothetical protein
VILLNDILIFIMHLGKADKYKCLLLIFDYNLIFVKEMPDDITVFHVL